MHNTQECPQQQVRAAMAEEDGAVGLA
eukprot:SAG31_NODE_15527_length_750_cov_1.165899_1_plen_26_part_10